MKKIAIIALSLFGVAVTSHALDISLGLRGSFNMGLGTNLEGNCATIRDNNKTASELDDGATFKEGGNLGGGASLFANFGFLDLGPGTLGLQPEVMINFNNGYNFSINTNYGKYKYTLHGNSIDIPLFVTYQAPIGESFKIGLGVGPYISIPLGCKEKWDIPATAGTSSEYEPDSTNINFGIGFDLNAGYKVGPGYIVFDAKYLTDITTTAYIYSGSKYDVFTRRALLLGLGYELKLM